MTAISKISEQNQSALAERLITAGDLASLTGAERIQYYLAMCDRCGLDPLSRPFDYIETSENGKKKVALYANQIAAAQLRRKHQISLKIVDRRSEEGLYMVTCQASTPGGRTIESIGVVPIVDYEGKQLKPLARANAIKKAETQAYRRATIAICGLDFSGMDDEESIVKSEYFDPPMDAIEINTPVQPTRQIEVVKDISFDRSAAYKSIKTELDRLGWSSEECQSKCAEKYGVESAKDLTDTELIRFLDFLKAQKAIAAIEPAIPGLD